MATHTYYDLKCQCGQTGKIKMKENDHPHPTGWEEYSLLGFQGESFYIRGSARWPEVFAKMKPSCQTCGVILTENNLAK